MKPLHEQAVDWHGAVEEFHSCPCYHKLAYFEYLIFRFASTLSSVLAGAD